VRLRETTYNEELADLVLNRTVQKKVYDTPDRIIQKSDPVLMGPVSRNGRAHFYAPYKMVGNLRIGTLWFNLLYIWWANTNFFITLYFDLLRKLLNLSDKRSITGFGIIRMGAR
jgi:hypothetical protein